MAGLHLESAKWQGLLDRMCGGDASALDELLRSAGRPLDRLVHKRLKGFPGVGRWVQSEDVLQNALVRLIRALRQVQPASVQQFFGLAAKQVQRELLDLARHYGGPAHSEMLQGFGGGASAADQRDEAPDLDEWTAFHEQVGNLPPEEREVVGLLFYHGWTQAKVADLFNVTIRTVQRRWQTALQTLRQRLADPV